MDHFETIVLDYLRADRSMFVNYQCCIQLNPGSNPDTSGPHWYCDAVAVGFKQQAVYLCEITYASPPASLMRRLTAWSKDWLHLRQALARDSSLPASWPVTPWLFIPRSLQSRMSIFLSDLDTSEMPVPRITYLEDVLPWQYRSWDRVPDAEYSVALPTAVV